MSYGYQKPELIEKITECCGPPHTVSYLKYVEKIGQLYSQLCQRLAVKVKAIGEMKKCDKAESLELQDNFNFTNLSEENKEQVIAGLKEKFVHQQTIIAKQKKFLKSFSKSLKMLSALELLHQKPLKSLTEFQEPLIAVELKFQSDLDRYQDESGKIIALKKLSESVCLKDKEVAMELVLPMMEEILTKFNNQIALLRADIRARTSSTGPWSRRSQYLMAKEGIGQLYAERRAVLENISIIEDWNRAQMSTLRKMKEQQAALFKSLKEHVQENERLLCALLCIKASVLTDYGSLQDDYISVLQLQSENRDVIIQTINMKLEMLEKWNPATYSSV